MIRLKLDVKKINKDLLFKGEKGTYCDITLMDNRDGTDEWGNDGFAVQDVGKERREAGEKGPIIGNWKHVGQKPSQAAPPARQKPPLAATNDSLDQDPDDVHF